MKVRLAICAKTRLLSSMGFNNFPFHPLFKASLVHLPCSINIGTLFLVVELFVSLVILSGVFCYPLLFVPIIHFVAYKVYYALGQPSTS